MQPVAKCLTTSTQRNVAGTLDKGTPGRGIGHNGNYDSQVVSVTKEWPAQISSTLDTTFGTKQGLEDQHVNAGCPMFVPAIAIQGNLIGRDNGGPQGVGASEGVMYTLTKADVHAVAQPIPIDTMNHIGRKDSHSLGDFEPGAPSYTLTKGHSHAVAQPIAPTLTAANNPSRSPQASEVTDQIAAVYATSMAVRRLTPVECERLQGFPDGYTDIQLKGKPTPDGPRYKALGNSMAVPVMRWIGQRIEAVDKIK
jgi:DNA (cytosine-5)-methyltransferase 1